MKHIARVWSSRRESQAEGWRGASETHARGGVVKVSTSTFSAHASRSEAGVGFYLENALVLGEAVRRGGYGTRWRCA